MCALVTFYKSFTKRPQGALPSQRPKRDTRRIRTVPFTCEITADLCVALAWPGGFVCRDGQHHTRETVYTTGYAGRGPWTCRRVSPERRAELQRLLEEHPEGFLSRPSPL